MHLDVEQIERLRDGELDAAQEMALRAHVRDCPHCERRLAAATREDEEVAALLSRLDHPAPAVGVGTVVGRASARRPRWWRIAAAVALALAAAGAAYAVPGSPLPGLLRGAADRLAPPPPPAPAPPDPAPGPSAPAAPRPSGVAVAPGSDFGVVFAAPQESGVARVRVVDSPEVEVRALGGRVPFDLGVDRVTVANAGAAADYEVLLPRSAPSVRIQVGAAVVLRKEGGRIVSRAAPDSLGAYTIPIRAGGN